MLLLEQMLLFKMVSTSKLSIHYVSSSPRRRTDVHERVIENWADTHLVRKNGCFAYINFLWPPYFFLFFSGACLSRCTILQEAVVRSHSWIHSAIIGWKSVVGQWVSQVTAQYKPTHLLHTHPLPLPKDWTEGKWLGQRTKWRKELRALLCVKSPAWRLSV